MSRIVYRVLPDGNNWKVTRESVDQHRFAIKAEAVREGQSRTRGEWENAHRLTQLVVHKADGTFAHEYTYGEDPFPPRG